jgi:hypothetical protein
MMEGILLDIEMFASPVTVLLGLVLLAIGACGILLGYMADEETKGNRLFWAEWPLPGSEEPASPALEREYLKAA